MAWDDDIKGPGGIRYGVWIPRDPNYVKKQEPKAPETPKAPANDWIKIKVMDDQSGEVIPKVKLVLKTPDNSTEEHETRLSGLIESLGLQSGNCELSGDLSDLTIDNTLVFVGMGNSPIGQQGASPFKPGKLPAPAPGSKYRIATVEEHKVKTGETLESVAKSAGMTWKALAKFNWGTDNPEEINKHLHWSVGCTKKTADGKDFLFDNSDNPGIVYVPKKWTESGLQTGEFHTIRVRQMAISYKLPVTIEIDPGQDSSADDQVTLIGGSSVDSALYRQMKSVKDDVLVGDNCLDLLFTDLQPNLNYWLEVDPGKEGEKYYAFENVSWNELEPILKKW